jgi:hypothetical protein
MDFGLRKRVISAQHLKVVQDNDFPLEVFGGSWFFHSLPKRSVAKMTTHYACCWYPTMFVLHTQNMIIPPSVQPLVKKYGVDAILFNTCNPRT